MGTKTENFGKEDNHGKVCHLVKGTQVFLQSVCYVCPFLNRSEIRRQILVKFLDVDFHGKFCRRDPNRSIRTEGKPWRQQ